MYSFITDVCICTTLVTQWRIICNHQNLKMTFFQETAITASALLHLTWKRGHYMLQQEFRNGFSAVPKSLF
jgi:hypothetical protein